MKHLKYLIIILVTFGSLTSCKKYFDVDPKTETERSKLFENETGFKDALAGVYIYLKDDQAYGQAMTMTTMEYLVSSWDVTTNSVGQQLGLFDYNSLQAETALANIFRQQYKVIANINSILEQIDSKKAIFKPGIYELIKGECLGLRAYCHFDLLRLFGPVPAQPTTGNLLPYVTKLSKTQNLPVSYEEFKRAILNDLSESENLLKDNDPFTANSISDFRTGISTAKDDFSSFRYLRMNYYAVKALQARAYLWFDERQKANECAKFVISAINSNGSQKFRLGNASDMSAKDFVLTNEHIFGLYDFKLSTKYNTLFGSGNIRKGTDEFSIKNQLYENTGTDIREAHLWELISSGSVNSYVMKKYLVTPSPANLTVDFNQLPMLRISEMYFIAIETSDLSEAQVFSNTFRSSRNLTNITVQNDIQLRKNDLLKEYRKEFYGEGQAFFAYKRANAPKSSVLFAPSAAIINYVPPMPKIETF